jgi:YidC/Oxa1 family membrane protein insertase
MVVLNFIYYPVSGILLVWHKVFGFLLGANSGIAWALSVIFLVFTLRALLIKPFIGQVRSMRKMQEFQPQIKKLQEKYKGDRAKLAEETQKLQREHGVNPLGGCLPMLVQVPVFIGLLQVLKGFQPAYPDNYFFSRADILSFLDADLFGVRLSESIAGGAQALGHISFTNASFAPHVVPVALPLMIIASVATHFTARVSQSHQSATATANPQAAVMGKLTMWLFPLGVLVFGAFFPVAMLLYWLANNSWTLTQQHLVYTKIGKEERQLVEQAREQRQQRAPRVGQKPAGVPRGDTGATRSGTSERRVPSEEGSFDQESTRSGTPAATEDSTVHSSPKQLRPKQSQAGPSRRAPGKVGKASQPSAATTSTASGSAGSGPPSPRQAGKRSKKKRQ